MQAPSDNKIKELPTRILVVDDDPFMRRLLEGFLVKQRFSVHASPGTRDAENEIARQCYEIALIDILLGDENGMDLVDIFREHCPEIIIIIMTGHPTLETALNALKLGVQDYLIKPFKLEQLSGVLNRCLENRRIVTENNHLKRELEQMKERLAGVEHFIQPVPAVAPPRDVIRGDAAYRVQSLQTRENEKKSRLEKLAELWKDGILSEEEFETKKRQLMSS